MKLPGVISLRKDLPIWHTPKGSLRRVVRWVLTKLVKMPWAVSGRRYTVFLASSVTPWNVLNIRLNWRISVKLCLPQEGQGMLCSSMKSFISCWENASMGLGSSTFSCWHQSSMSLSARKRSLHSRQSIRGSEKPDRWPLATQVWGFMRMAASCPTL